MSDDGLLKKGLGQVGNLGKQIGKVVADETKKTVQTTKQQVGLEQGEKKPGQELEKLSEDEKKRVEGIKKDENKQFVMGLYAKTDDKNKVNDQQREAMVETAEKNQGKTPEEIQKIARLEQQLHKEEYYDPTFNPQKQEEEKPQERVERLEEEEEKKRWELQEKEEKKKPIAVSQAERKTEARVGSG